MSEPAPTTEEQPVLITKTVKVPIPFFFTLAANTQQTLISSPISVNYKIVSVEAHFRDDAAHNLLFYIISSNNRTTSTTTVPSGRNVISELSPTPYLTGEGEIIELELQYEPETNYQYIKTHAQNNNAYAITGLCVVTIEGQLKYTTDESSILPVTEKLMEATGKYQTEQYAKIRTILDTTTDFRKGTHPFIKEAVEKAKAQQETDADGVVQKFLETLNIPAYTPVSMPLKDRYKTTRAWLDKAMKLTYDTMTTDGLINMFVSAFGGSVIQWRKWLQESFSLEEKVNALLDPAFQIGMIKPVEQYWNSQYLSEYPNVSDLINMVVKEVIDLDTFKDTMKYQGISPKWSQKIWDAHFIQPNFGDIRTAIRRKFIQGADIDKYLKLMDLDPRYNDTVWKPLLEEIPPVSELINMKVKEKIDQDQFDAALGFWGYNPAWGKVIWDAHFSPPTFEDFVLAMRRKYQVSIPQAGQAPVSYKFGNNAENDVETIKKLSELADYDPAYWSFFQTRMYNDPTPRMSKWAYETGVIDKEKLKELVLRYGYTPEDSEWFSEMLIHFQERPYVTKYLTAVSAAYIANVIDAAELRRRVVAVPQNEEIAEWIIKIADVRKEIVAGKGTSSTPKLLSVSDLKKAYMYGEISEDQLRTELSLLGYPVIQVDLLINIINKTKEIEDFGGKKVALTVSEMFEAWRYGQMTESALRTELQLKGLNLTEIDILVNTRKTKWSIE